VKARGTRPERVASLIRQELASALLLESKDPGLDGIVLTSARVSADLRVAWIRYQLMDHAPEARVRAEEGLRRASGYLRGLMRRRLTMRTLPELRFEFDERGEAARRVGEILGDAGVGTEREEEK